MSHQRQNANQSTKATNHLLPLSFTQPPNNTQPQLFYSTVQPTTYQQQLQQLQLQQQQQQQQQQHFLQQVAPFQRQPQYPNNPQFIPNSTNALLNQQQQQQYFRNQAFVNAAANQTAFFPLVNQAPSPYASNVTSPTFLHQQQQLLQTNPPVSSTSPATPATSLPGFARESESAASSGVDDWLGVGADDNVEYDFTVAAETPVPSSNFPTNPTSVALNENDTTLVKDDAFPEVSTGPEPVTFSHGQAQPNLGESFQSPSGGVLHLEQQLEVESPQFTSQSIVTTLSHQTENLVGVKVASNTTPQPTQYITASNVPPPPSNQMGQLLEFSQYNAFVPGTGHAPSVSTPMSIMHTVPVDHTPPSRENMVQAIPQTSASPRFAQKFIPSPVLSLSEAPQQMLRGNIATPSTMTTNSNEDVTSGLPTDLDPAGVPVVLPDSPAAEIANMPQPKFMSSLVEFMKKRGATVKIPQWCGRKLDLHGLYKLVTQLGGMEAVERTKKWKSVAEKLSLTEAQNRTHATLKKHYVNLLAPFEEVHFLPYVRFQPHGQVARRASMQISQSPPTSQYISQAQQSLRSPHTQSQPVGQNQRQPHQQLHNVATSFPSTSMATTSVPVSYSPSSQMQAITEVTRYPTSHMPSPSISEQQELSMGRIDEVSLSRSTSQSSFPVQFPPTVNYAGARNNRFAPYPQQFPKVQQNTRQQQLQLQQQQLQFQQIQQHRYQQQQMQHQQYQQHQLQQQQQLQQQILQQRLQQQQQQQQLQQQRQHQQQQQMQHLQGADRRKSQDGQQDQNPLHQQKQIQQPDKVQTGEQMITQEQQEGQEQEYNIGQLQPQEQQQFQHVKQEFSEDKQYQEQQLLLQGQQRQRQNSIQPQPLYQHVQLAESRNSPSPLLYQPQNSASPSTAVGALSPGVKQEFSPVQQTVSPTSVSAGHFVAPSRIYAARPPMVNNPYTPMIRTVESIGGVDARLLEQNTSRPIYPQLQNLGAVDIHATTMSLKCGLALEVSSALNKLLAISAHPNVRIPFVQCPFLLEALLDIVHQGVPRLPKNPMPLQVLRDMVEEENTLASLMVDEFTEPESRSTLCGEEDEDTKRVSRLAKAKGEQWVAQALAAITILRNLSMEVAENPAILAGHQRAVPLLARCLVCDAGGGIYTFEMEANEERIKSELTRDQVDDKDGKKPEDDGKNFRSGHDLLGLPTFPSLTAKSKDDSDGMDDASDLGISAGDALEFRKSALTILDTAAAHVKLRCTADATFFMHQILDFVSFALQSQQFNTSLGDSPADSTDDGYGNGGTYYAGLAIELYGKASVSDENRNAISGCEREVLKRAFRSLADSLLGFPMERVEACANPRNSYPFSPPFFSPSTATVLAATVELARLENLLTAIHNTVLLVDDAIIEEMSQYPYFVSCLIRSAIFPRFRSSNAYPSQQAYRSPSRSPNPVPPSPSLDTLPVRRRAMATLAQMSKRTGSVRLMHGDAFIAALMDPAENDKADPEIVAGLLEVLYPGGGAI